MKRLVAAGLVGVVLLALAVVFVVRHVGGPLAEVGNGFGGPVQVGKPFTAYYELVNDGNHTIEIEKVSLGDHTSGLRFLGAKVQVDGPSVGGPRPGFPPPDQPKSGLVGVEEFLLGGHGRAPLLIGLRADRLGDYSLKGVRVEYRVRYHAEFGPRYRRTITTQVNVCVQRGPNRRGRQSCQPSDDFS